MTKPIGLRRSSATPALLAPKSQTLSDAAAVSAAQAAAVREQLRRTAEEFGRDPDSLRVRPASALGEHLGLTGVRMAGIRGSFNG
ncbi:hypothetical protein [Streptomyces spinosirectus]